MKTILRALTRGKYTLLAVVAALTLGTASVALAGSGVGGVFNLGVTNSVNAITTLVGSVAGPMLRIDNNSAGVGATALNLQVEPGKPPMTVNSVTRVTNLNADQVDSKNANDLSRVAVMNTSDTEELSTTEETYGTAFSITAPAAGFVRVNGNVTVINSAGSPCTSGCQFTAYVRHINTGNYSIPQQEDALNRFGNAGLDAVFPVNAGVNTFDIRLYRNSGDGTLYGWWGVLTAEYTPYGSTGTGSLSASGLAAASKGPISKELPRR